MDGVKLTVTDEAVTCVAKQAIEMKTGVRALRSIFEKIMLNIMYEVPQNKEILEVIIDESCISGSDPKFIMREWYFVFISYSWYRTKHRCSEITDKYHILDGW